MLLLKNPVTLLPCVLYVYVFGGSAARLREMQRFLDVLNLRFVSSSAQRRTITGTSELADLHEFNKMNERAVAIVMAPNLYDAKTSRGKSRRRPCLAADGDAPPVPPAPAAQAARCWSRKKQPET